jgi:DNA gyrase subunit A
VDGDSPAAMRYTEIRMARIAHELLADLDKETVDFVPNYDGSEHEPVVMPTRVPNLLVNGSAGIAVGMATNVPPHNAREVLDACIAYLDDPDIGIDGLMEHLPGPDFPTGATINGAAGIREAYHTGRGRIYLRAKAHVEEGEGNERSRVVFTEIPYQVNKARLIEKIAELVRARKIEGIAELRDESDKDGIRVVAEVRRDAVPEVLLNRLYRHTQFETVFGINMVALVDGQPRTLDLKQVIRGFIRHRREVVTRRTIFELKRARARAHVLEGLAVALANIDEVIELIRASASPAEAREGLTARLWEAGVVVALLEDGADLTRPEDEEDFGIDRSDTREGSDAYRLSATQAQAILDMRLNRLTGLEQDKIVNEYKGLIERIKSLVEILEDPDRLLSVIREELLDITTRFATDPRRTVIDNSYRGFDREDLVTPEDVAVTLSYAGYVKARPLGEYRAQRRGGRGRMATRTKQEDFVDRLFIAHTHDTLLCFSDRGLAYWLKVYEIPQAGAASRGTPIVNLLPLAEGERISAVLPVRDFGEGGYVFMATRGGIVKKTELAAFSRPRTAGIIAVHLDAGDSLAGVVLTDGERDIMLFSSGGKAIRFREQDVRSMGRTSRGVRGMDLGKEERVISLILAGSGQVLSVTANGFGKRTPVEEFRIQRRAGMGLIAIKTSPRNGDVVGALLVEEGDEVVLITDSGTLMRTGVEEISLVGRNTQGVRVIRPDSDGRLVSLDRAVEENGEEGGETRVGGGDGDGDGAPDPPG